MAEVVRSIQYKELDDELQPVLCIEPKVQRTGHKANFAIRIQDLWMYTPDTNKQFDKWMYFVVSSIYDQFNLGVISTQRMAEVATVIEDGITELLNAPPDPPSNSAKAAEIEAIANQSKQSREIHLNE